MNIVQVTGRLVRDPELRFVGNGYPIAELNIAVDDANGRYDKETKKSFVGSGFYQVEIPGNYGELIVEQVEKGDNVHVSGSLTQWVKEKEDGTKESRTRIRADVVTVLKNPNAAPRQPRQQQNDQWSQGGPQGGQGGQNWGQQPQQGGQGWGGQQGGGQGGYGDSPPF